VKTCVANADVLTAANSNHRLALSVPFRGSLVAQLLLSNSPTLGDAIRENNDWENNGFQMASPLTLVSFHLVVAFNTTVNTTVVFLA
jgi:hypothetical protein